MAYKHVAATHARTSHGLTRTGEIGGIQRCLGGIG